MDNWYCQLREQHRTWRYSSTGMPIFCSLDTNCMMYSCTVYNILLNFILVSISLQKKLEEHQNYRIFLGVDSSLELNISRTTDQSTDRPTNQANKQTTHPTTHTRTHPRTYLPYSPTNPPTNQPTNKQIKKTATTKTNEFINKTKNYPFIDEWHKSISLSGRLQCR